MTNNAAVATAEDHVRTLAEEVIRVRDGECLLCYVNRMLEFGCTGLRWAARYRDVCAPRVAGLARRLGRMGGFCDCEIFMNAYQPAPELWVQRQPAEPDGYVSEYDLVEPEVMPPCAGIRKGSTQPCSLWVRHYRGW